MVDLIITIKKENNRHKLCIITMLIGVIFLSIMAGDLLAMVYLSQNVAVLIIGILMMAMHAFNIVCVITVMDELHNTHKSKTADRLECLKTIIANV
jgi:hypothetical protein